MYRRMVRIRRFEETASALYKDGDDPRFVHLSIGQEATAVGACWPLARPTASRRRTAATDTASPRAWTWSRCSPSCSGTRPACARGSVARCTSPTPAIGMLGANGIVGAGLPIATGSATASAIRRDAARHRGVLRRRRGRHRRLPRIGQSRRVVALADHLLLREQRVRRVLADGRPASGAGGASSRRLRHRGRRGRRRGRRGGRSADGDALSRGFEPVPDRSSSRRTTHRWHGHYEGDPQRYRPDDEAAQLRADDPLQRVARRDRHGRRFRRRHSTPSIEPSKSS